MAGVELFSTAQTPGVRMRQTGTASGCSAGARSDYMDTNTLLIIVLLVLLLGGGGFFYSRRGV